MADISGSSNKDRPPGPDQVTADIWKLVPNVEDFDRMEYVMRPYVMRIPKANYQSGSLNTDAHGFRRLVTENGVVTLDRFKDALVPKGILCGDSTVFGYGVNDDETFQALLSRRNDNAVLWYSFAVPVANLLQNRLLLELFMPAKFDYLVLVVSTLSPVTNLLKSFDSKPYPPLFGQTTDAAYSAGFTSKAQRRYKLASGVIINDPQNAFQDALDEFRRNLSIISVTLRAMTSARLLLCFRANPSWVDKELTSEEEQMMALFERKHRSHIAVTSDEELRPMWLQYVDKVAEVTRHCGGDFIDFNRIDALKAPEWLFFDQFHQNAKGTALLAEQIGKWVDRAESPAAP